MDTKWTDEVDAEAAELYQTFSEAKIRRYQDLCSQQIRMAYDQRHQRPEAMARAISDLQKMHDALSRELLRRLAA